MRWRYLCCALAALLVCACATRLPESADEPVVAQMRAHPERLIVLAVANHMESLPLRAGSTPGGYGMVRPYTASENARTTIMALASEYGLREVAAWPIDALKLHCVVLEATGTAPLAEVLDALARDKRVALAQQLHTFDTLGTGPSYNDPYFDLQNGFKEIDAAPAQRISQGKSVRIALIDTGVDTRHPDLQSRIAMTQNFVDQSGQFDQDRHGTEVAGIIAANANNHQGIVGIAPAAQLIALKACWPLKAQDDGRSQCNTFTLAQALAAAIGSGAQIINLSVGGPADPLLTKLVSESVKRGIVVIGAVPPNGDMSGFPVGIPGVIAVDAASKKPAAPQILLAPGREVLTLRPGGSYDFASGSSLATAHVTGAAALLLALDSRLDGRSIHSLLNDSSSASAAYPRIINVCKALAALRAGSSCAVP